jgi:hypothetical protein
MTKIITKAGTTKKITIGQNGREASYIATVTWGEGWEEVRGSSRTFKTLKGAERWAAKQLA